MNQQQHGSIWTTLIPLLIGAGLTLLTQFLIEHYKSKKESRKRRLELISNGRAKTYLIAQVLKDLSMYKVHKQYYYRAYVLSSDKSDKEDNMKKHYEKGQEQRSTESKLDGLIADYFQIVTEYSILKDNKDTHASSFEKIYSFSHPKSSKLTNCNTEAELIIGLEQEEQRLREEYDSFFNMIEGIQNRLN